MPAIRPAALAIPPSLIQSYYWATSLFVVADVGFGVSVRAAGLAQPGWRYAYYALCIACAVAIRRWPAYTALVGMSESALNLLLLMLGVMMPIFNLTETAFTAGDAGTVMSPAQLVNVLITGAVLWLSFQRSQAALAGTNRWTRRVTRG